MTNNMTLYYIGPLTQDLNIVGDVTLYGGTLNFAQNSLTINGNITIDNVTVDVNGGKLKVIGNLLQKSSVVSINGGRLEVTGNYETQYGTSSYLVMTNANDYVLVGGNFVMASVCNHTNYLTAGTLEVKGDFTQRICGGDSGYNFKSRGTHKVVLSGSGLQTITFDVTDYEYSRFNILEINNNYKLQFNSSISVNKLISNIPIMVNNMALVYLGPLTQDLNIVGDVTLVCRTLNLAQHTLTINGNMTLTDGKVDLNGGKLIVKGDLLQININFENSVMNINGGRLEVGGDYTFRTGKAYYGGSLQMTNSNDYVLVNGNFSMESSINTNYFTAGTLEIKGNFTQKSTFGTMDSIMNFDASGSHKVILSGNTLQNVYFDSPGPSHFNILYITKPLSTGYTFNVTPVWNTLIYGYYYQTKFGKSGTYSPTGNFSRAFTDMSVKSPGFDLDFSRTYNSRNDKSTALGRGWTFSFESRIINTTYSTKTKEVMLPDGSMIKFNLNDDGTITALDSRNTITNTADGFVITTKDQHTYKYDLNGYLVEIKDKNGNTITIVVDGSGKVQRITDQAGKVFEIAYENGLMKSITDVAGGRTVTYEYENGCLVRAIDPMNKVTNYSYDSDGFLNEIRDTNNKLIESVTYFHSGENKDKVNTTTNSKGNVFTYTYDNVNKLTVITDKNGKVMTQSYDSSYCITTSVDADTQPTAIEYPTDSLGENKYSEQKSVTDRNGNKTQYERDANGNITKVINPDLTFKLFQYDAKNNKKFEQDEEGNKTYYVFDAQMVNLLYEVKTVNKSDTYNWGPVDATVKSKFAVTSYRYYADGENGYLAKGLVKSVTDPMNNTTNYTYYPNGSLYTVSDPETGKLTTYVYNWAGWLISETSPRNITTTYAYNSNGQLERTTVTDPVDTTKKSVNRTVYDNMGRKTQEITPNLYDESKDDLANHKYNDASKGTRYSYNSIGQLETVTDAENNITAYTYDIYGNIETEKKPNNSIYTYHYDAINRISKVYFQDDAAAPKVLLEEYTYTILSDKRTNTTVTRYINNTDTTVTSTISDYAGRAVEQDNPDGTKPLTEYYRNGDVKTTTDGNGNKTYFYYDKYDSVLGVSYDEKYVPVENVSGTIKYTYIRTDYDKNGNKLSEKVGKSTVTLGAIPTQFINTDYLYYNNNKVKQVFFSNGRKTIYTYDDDLNVSSEEVFTDASNFKITAYEYNYMGKPSKMIVTVKKGDLAGNDFNDITTQDLVTFYEYYADGSLKSTTTPDNVVTTYTYDNLGRQLSVSQPGKDENGNLVTITKSTTYNWGGKPLTTIDALNNTTNYYYNQRGFLEKVTNTVAAKTYTTAFWYDRAGRKIAEVSPVNYDSAKAIEGMNRVVYTYDSMDRLKTKSYLGEEKKVVSNTFAWTTTQVNIIQEAYKYDGNGNVVKKLDALGYEAATDETSVDTQINTGYGTEYTYNLANKVLTVLDPVSKGRSLAYTVKYGYDALGRKTSETNAKGAITSYYYDDAGNITSVGVKKTSSDPEKIVKSATYDLLGNVLTQTDGNLNVTTYEYNSFNQLRKAVFPGDTTIPQNTVIYQYDVMGNLTFQQDTKGATDLYTYDNQGRQLTHTQQKADGSEKISTSVRYDVNGNKRFVSDGNDKTNENTYDELNRLKTSKINVSGIDQITTYSYDANGNQTAVADWRGNTSTNSYDGLNRLIEKKDQFGKVIQKLEYNHNNLQSRSYDALNNYTDFTYDKNNRLLSTIDPENHTTSQTYDNVGNIDTKKDGKNNVTTFTYDEYNRLSSVKNAKNETTSYTYDLNGNMLTQTDGKTNATIFEYNCGNKVIRKIDQGGRTGTVANYTYVPVKVESYTYNADGTLKTKTDRNNNTTTYNYDIHGRLLSQTVGEITISYTYDQNGNQLTMADGTGTTTRTYDELNRVLTKQVPNIGTSTLKYDVTSGMDAGCWAETSTDPKGNITTKVYDKAGRLWKVIADGQTTVYQYYDNGSRKSVLYQGGAREDYTYYKDNLVKTLTNKKADGSTIDTYTYTYDGAHNQLTKSDAKGNTTYTYDVLNRLETVTEPNTVKTSYTFDAAGNRATETVVAGTNTTLNTYAYNEQNKLLSVTTKVNGTVTDTTGYGYDNNGNQLTTTVNGVVTVTNTYDKLNQLVTTVTGGTTVTNTYNGDGLRVSKNVNGSITRTLYEYDKVVLELDGSGNQVARNVYGTNLLTRSIGADKYSYMYNGHADVVALIDGTGAIKQTYYYDAFGNITEQSGTVNNSITYAGYQWDKETGLYYLNARMYDAKIARFLQEDTYRGSANDPLSLNLYTYCHNEPLMYTDPTGHWAVYDEDGISLMDTDWIRDEAYHTNTDEYVRKKINSQRNEKIQYELTKLHYANVELKEKYDKDEPNLVRTYYGDVEVIVNAEEGKPTEFLGTVAAANKASSFEDYIDVRAKMLKARSKPYKKYSSYSFVYDFTLEDYKRAESIFYYSDGQVDEMELRADGYYDWVKEKYSIKKSDMTQPGMDISIVLAAYAQSGTAKAYDQLRQAACVYGTTNALMSFGSEKFYQQSLRTGVAKTWFQKATKPNDYLNEALNRQGLKNAPNSLKEKWSEYGYDFEVRAHPADPKYGKTGSIYRVGRRQQGVDANGQGYGWEYMDKTGNWYHTSVLKTNNAAAEATHIQLP